MKVQVLKGGPLVDVVDNAFCPTGQGGGVDPTCGSGGGGKGSSGSGGSSSSLSIKLDSFGSPTKAPKGYREDRSHTAGGYLHGSSSASAVKKLKKEGFSKKLSKDQYQDKEGRVGVVVPSKGGVSIFVYRPASIKKSPKDAASSFGDRVGRTVER